MKGTMEEAPFPRSEAIDTVLRQIDRLPADWHGAGVLNSDVLERSSATRTT